MPLVIPLRKLRRKKLVGEELIGVAVISSCLLLFVNFFNRTYYTKKPRAVTFHMPHRWACFGKFTTSR